MLQVLLKALRVYHRYVKLKYFVPSGEFKLTGEVFFNLPLRTYPSLVILLSLPWYHHFWAGDCVMRVLGL